MDAKEESSSCIYCKGKVNSTNSWHDDCREEVENFSRKYLNNEFYLGAAAGVLSKSFSSTDEIIRAFQEIYSNLGAKESLQKIAHELAGNKSLRKEIIKGNPDFYKKSAAPWGILGTSFLALLSERVLTSIAENNLESVLGKLAIVTGGLLTAGLIVNDYFVGKSNSKKVLSKYLASASSTGFNEITNLYFNRVENSV